VAQYHQRPAQDFNDDSVYSASVQDVLTLVPWARALMDLQAAMPHEKDLEQLQIEVGGLVGVGYRLGEWMIAGEVQEC
jgi:hypothetical protein